MHFVEPAAAMYLNEDGKAEGLALNHRATALLWVHNSAFRGRDVVAGPAFIVGPPNRHSDDTSAPDFLVELLFATARYRVQVKVKNDLGWRGNDVAFTDWLSAYHAAIDLAHRWVLVEEVRVIPEPDEVLISQWLQLGRRNPWIREADDPPFTRASFFGCYSVDELEERLSFTNWALGTAFFYRNLCFINQVDGGDEWLTIKSFNEEGRPSSLAFESITSRRYIEEGDFNDLIERLLKASKEDCRRLTY